ncbi:cysteine-rich and transmembrane domain-containing protein 1-like [Brachyistius frenatus]|uniref:cysteine-rich and transmembrane domain-containing protein 1-like n=1 Tax=Brachyistius frenatus TaxID=100188 RepID=UPI0037E7BBF3
MEEEMEEEMEEGGPPAPGYPPALISQPGTFPGSPYQRYYGNRLHSLLQTFPQTYAVGGDPSYHGGHHPGAMPPHGASPTQPGYHGAPYAPKQTVYLVDGHRDQGGGSDSCLAACSTALCCCCLWDLLTGHH